MGWLIGLPLGIFRMLAGFLMLALRLAVPVAVVLLVIFVLRRMKKGPGGTDATGAEPPKEPEFHGPVYTVEYEEVKEAPRPKTEKGPEDEERDRT
ncbi:hypothetical protein [Oscillibacter sp.]|uniref:hypothetical protein n=1 Tax=Oscillibacter sp. TaxID=1945593 RepID=UPI00262A8CFB|nr:hypothetical protein [Oscillibacter sp.]MDD3346373.1 hypothetical protein [Oscillibacter sp.]